MPQGKPALWGSVLGVPFLFAGSYVYLFELQDGSTEIEFLGTTLSGGHLTHPEFFAIPLVAFGGFVILMGAYVQIVAPQPPVFGEGETVIEKRRPTQRVARAKILSGLPFLFFTFYLLEFTIVPYVYPTGVFVVGLGLLSSGLYRYWRNTLTEYYITSERVIRNYRFLSLSQKEIPLEKVRGIEEARSVTETMLDIGSVKIASAGGGGTVTLRVTNIRHPSEFANEIRKLT
ncbi:MAG: PH domain-containing protein [Natronomonas sp.]